MDMEPGKNLLQEERVEVTSEIVEKVVKNASLLGCPVLVHAEDYEKCGCGIKKAKEIDPDGEYHHADLQEWRPEIPVDLVHSMEVFYYVEDTNAMLSHIATWLKPDGYLIFGVDRYMENPESHDWDSQVGCFMALLSEDEWSKVVTDAGFSIIKRWRAAPDPSRDWPGTLAFLCIRNG